jgi:hypothetical protein
VQTHAIAQTSPQLNSDELDTKVLFGTPAPFTGVLVPEVTYRDYQKQIEKYQFELKQDQTSADDPAVKAEISVDVGSTVIKVGIGFCIGLIVGGIFFH